MKNEIKVELGALDTPKAHHTPLTVKEIEEWERSRDLLKEIEEGIAEMQK